MVDLPEGPTKREIFAEESSIIQVGPKGLSANEEAVVTGKAEVKGST